MLVTRTLEGAKAVTETTEKKPQNFQQYEEECRKFVSGFTADNPTAIVQYVRLRQKPRRDSEGNVKPQTNGGKGRQKKGVIIAFKGLQGEIRAGYSLCNTKKEKRGFKQLVGLRKAITHAIPIDEINWEEVPHGARKTLGAVCERARKYFNNED
jgi:hypothetical protein